MMTVIIYKIERSAHPWPLSGDRGLGQGLTREKLTYIPFRSLFVPCLYSLPALSSEMCQERGGPNTFSTHNSIGVK